MLRTREIPKAGWPSFLAAIGRLLVDRPIRIEVIGRPLGDQEMSYLQPFRSLDYDAKGSERDTLTVTVGGDRGELRHRIVGPKRLYTVENEQGEIEWLGIEESGEAGDVRTLIHFEHLPEVEAHPEV